MNWFAGLETAQNALAVLTAMITPAVLISACGALIFSTSTRMGRVVDRVRTLSERFENLAKHPEQDDMFEERRALILGQLDRQTSRARLLQRAMLFFYIALSTFVATRRLSVDTADYATLVAHGHEDAGHLTQLAAAHSERWEHAEARRLLDRATALRGPSAGEGPASASLHELVDLQVAALEGDAAPARELIARIGNRNRPGVASTIGSSPR